VWVRLPPLAPKGCKAVTNSEQNFQHVHFVSLGCPKNLVDTEVMLGHLARDGYKAVADPQEADVIVVNTCGFIDAAKEESVNTILEMGEYKKGRCKTLVVAGCLSQRYAPELAKEMPEVDHFLGTGNFEKIAKVLREAGNTEQSIAEMGVTRTASDTRMLPILDVKERDHPRLHGKNALVPFKHFPDPDSQKQIFVPAPEFTLTSQSPRLSTQPKYTSYVKVSEGCSNTCAFCIIPKLRGPQRSRNIDDIVVEVERLLAGGVKEINLIAQDLCAYGKDQNPRQTLAELLRTLDGLGSDFWIRCLYAYPRGLTQEVMDVMASAKNIVPYLDMPLQHIAEPILQNMRRGKGGDATRELLKRLRTSVPGIVMRTTFITGLPGETEAHFQEMYDLVEEMRFERMGVFTYSREEDTPAGVMPDQVPPEVSQERSDRLMALQKRISAEQQEALIGSTLEVLVEGVSEETDLLLKGRHKGQAPDIDGITYINSGTASPGDVVQVLVDQAMDYDLVGGIVSTPGTI
jgi:ribosomal protein S12 methylthiotransferase